MRTTELYNRCGYNPGKAASFGLQRRRGVLPNETRDAGDRSAFEREKWKAEYELEQRKLMLLEHEQSNHDSDLQLRRTRWLTARR